MNLLFDRVDTEFYGAEQLPRVDAALYDIKLAFGPQINQASAATGVPAELIASFIFIESGGNATVVSSSGAVGLMQINPATATDTCHLLFKGKSKLMTSSAETLLTQLLGQAKVNKLKKMRWMGDGDSVFTRTDLLKPGLNILAGSLYLQLLIHQEKTGNRVRLDRVVVRYNRGYNAKIPAGGINEVFKGYNGETRAYLAKLVGRNSVIERLA